MNIIFRRLIHINLIVMMQCTFNMIMHIAHAVHCDILIPINCGLKSMCFSYSCIRNLLITYYAMTREQYFKNQLTLEKKLNKL